MGWCDRLCFHILGKWLLARLEEDLWARHEWRFLAKIGIKLPTGPEWRFRPRLGWRLLARLGQRHLSRHGWWLLTKLEWWLLTKVQRYFWTGLLIWLDLNVDICERRLLIRLGQRILMRLECWLLIELFSSSTTQFAWYKTSCDKKVDGHLKLNWEQLTFLEDMPQL